MVVTQIILLSQWFNIKKPSQKDQPKRPSQNGQVQINLSKMAPWSSQTWWQTNHWGGFFYQNSKLKKLGFLIVVKLGYVKLNLAKVGYLN